MTKVIALKEAKHARDKWSKEVTNHGLVAVPSLLLAAQAKLKLSPTHFSMLMLLFAHQEDPSTFLSSPLNKELSKSTGLSQRQTRRILAQLETAGFIERIPDFSSNGRRCANLYDLSGVYRKLEELPPKDQVLVPVGYDSQGSLAYSD